MERQGTRAQLGNLAWKKVVSESPSETNADLDPAGHSPVWDPGKVTSSEFYFPHLLNRNIPSNPEQLERGDRGLPQRATQASSGALPVSYERVPGPSCALTGGGHDSRQTRAVLSLLYLTLLCLLLKGVKWWPLKDVSTQNLRVSLIWNQSLCRHSKEGPQGPLEGG